METTEPEQQYLPTVPYWNKECGFLVPLAVSLEEQREEQFNDVQEHLKALK